VDLKGLGYGAAEVAALAAQHFNADSAYIASAKWGSLEFRIESLKWQPSREPRVSPATVRNTTMAWQPAQATSLLTWASEHFSPGMAASGARRGIKPVLYVPTSGRGIPSASGMSVANNVRDITQRPERTSNSYELARRCRAALLSRTQPMCLKERKTLKLGSTRFWPSVEHEEWVGDCVPVPPGPWRTERGLRVCDECRQTVALYGTPIPAVLPPEAGQPLELLYYAFDWAAQTCRRLCKWCARRKKTASPDEWWKSLWQLPAYNENGEIKFALTCSPTKLPLPSGL